jgi:hypothetical protein
MGGRGTPAGGGLRVTPPCVADLHGLVGIVPVMRPVMRGGAGGRVPLQLEDASTV